jgi:hypothetical protein
MKLVSFDKPEIAEHIRTISKSEEVSCITHLIN